MELAEYLNSKGDAQSKVRQDILEGDCRTLQRVINAQLIKPWMRFNFGEAVADPLLVIECAAPEDEVAKANVLKTLYEAGFEADAAEVSEAFGWKLTKRAADSGARTMDPVDLVDTVDGRGNRDDGARGLGAEPPSTGDPLKAIAELANREDLSDADFKRELMAMASEAGFGEMEDFETVIQNVIAAGIAAGRQHTRRMMKR